MLKMTLSLRLRLLNRFRSQPLNRQLTFLES